MSQTKGKGQDEFRAAVTMTVVWVAGLTLVIIFAALLTGLWLDKILSIPVTLILTFRVVRKATARIKPGLRKDVFEEEPNCGEDK
jgi:hypothetical protein